MEIFMNHVPVIASFNKQGKIKPLYVMINGEQFKIVESYYAVHEGAALYDIYNCTIDDHGVQKGIRLTFNFSQHAWTLYC